MFYCCKLSKDRILWLIQDPGSGMYDQWIVVQWQEVIFFSKASRLGLESTQPLFHRILEASFIGGKLTMAWSLTIDCHVMLRIRMCRAVVKLYDSDFWALLQGFEKHLVSIVISVSPCPHGTTQLPPDGFSWSIIVVFFF